jgi:hypothetical protein
MKNILGWALLVVVAACGSDETGGGGGADPAGACDESCSACNADCPGLCGTCDGQAVCSSVGACVEPAIPELSFFVSSVGNGARGGDFGGVEGADGFCQALGEAVGSGRTWRAYLSSSAGDARDRIGAGPWVNAKGVTIAADVASLHEAGLAADAAVDEFGQPVPTVSPNNQHDILTGSNLDGTASGSDCAGYTSSSRDDVVTVGHCDAADPVAAGDAWNNAHDSNGCDQEELNGTGSASRLYCFAID